MIGEIMKKLEDYTDKEIQDKFKKATTYSAISNLLKELRRRGY